VPSILLTGGTGFIGRHIARQLLESGFDVLALVREERKARELRELSSATLIKGTIADGLSVELPPNTILIHAAWERVRDLSAMSHIEKQYGEHYRFIKGALAQGVSRVIVIGSCFEYGQAHGPVTSHTPTNPNTPYAAAKDFLHKSLRLLQKEMSFVLIWARLFYLYGEGQDSRAIVPLLDAALDRGDETFRMSYGEQLLDYLPASVAAQKVVKLIEFSDGTYNVCSGTPISLRRLLEQRMAERGKLITLKLGHYGYRPQDSLAIWGADPV
jgi:nucleoside-diphosphate-sugar epimerase